MGVPPSYKWPRIGVPISEDPGRSIIEYVLVRGIACLLDDVLDCAFNLLPAAARGVVSGQHGAGIHQQCSTPAASFQPSALEEVGQRRPVIFLIERGSWYLATPTGEEKASMPAKQCWDAALQLHDFLQERINGSRNPFVLPVLVFPDMAPDADIEAWAAQAGVHLLLGVGASWIVWRSRSHTAPFGWTLLLQAVGSDQYAGAYDWREKPRPDIYRVIALILIYETTCLCSEYTI